MTPAEIKALRKRMGMIQIEFAVKLMTNVATVRAWEQGRSQPTAIFERELERLRKRWPERTEEVKP